MHILFDHGTPRGISRALQGHIVKEARAQGCDTLSNGDLLKAAEEAGFEVLPTTDTNLPHQQNLKGRKLQIGDRDSQQKQMEPGASHDATDCQRGERRKTRNLHSGRPP
jgi:hypothetical protein